VSELPLPERFNGEGLLPRGTYPLTHIELAASMLVIGPDNRRPTWDGAWRLELVRRLGNRVDQLQKAGIRQIYVDGSFVTDKDRPGDIDGYFVCSARQMASRQLAQQLAKLDPLWMGQFGLAPLIRDPFDPRMLHRPMWGKERIDLLPHFGQGCGLSDEFGNELDYPAAFRKTRDHQPKGIVRIVL
jgi:hypothetical protein